MRMADEGKGDFRRGRLLDQESFGGGDSWSRNDLEPDRHGDEPPWSFPI